MAEEHNHSHHHHHHHGPSSKSKEKHYDESEVFKNKNLQASRFRKLFKKWLYNILCIISILIIIYVAYIYIVD